MRNLRKALRPVCATPSRMKVAIEGCCHGELDNIYNHIRVLEQKNSYKVDLLLICGDFQAVRNPLDLECMSVPPKYRRLGDFHEYYSGAKKAPMLTIVIGGNHEASNYLWELYHGGWLAENIYFLGFSGCVNVNGLRIAGSSGIFSARDYNSGHYEVLPYDNSQLRSIYHTRQYDVLKLSLLSRPDIVLSHDWPQGIEHHGDLQGLLRCKSFFKSDIQSGRLGSPPMMDLLKRLQPTWWFAAHLHVKYEALYDHADPQSRRHLEGLRVAAESHGDTDLTLEANPEEIQIDDDDVTATNPDEILLEDEEADTIPAANTVPAGPSGSQGQTSGNTDAEVQTRFLALDKCLPKRQFLQVIDMSEPTPQPSGHLHFSFDREWLAISRALHPFLSTSKHALPLPSFDAARSLVENEMRWVNENVKDLEVSTTQTFWKTAPCPLPTQAAGRKQQPPWFTNPQTEALCRFLGIQNKVNPPPKALGGTEGGA